MRPIRLTVQGLTAYRQPAEIDFSDLDLFAITGPTGAGKTSLVDAMTYALFGQVPRVGDNVKQLISQGEERLKVSLEFASNGDRYRIIRSTATKGMPTVQLERFDPSTEEWKGEEDRAREANEHVERILGMDYGGFVRSVLLPQGQFQQFLAGKPEERRKVLDGILRLDVYARMLQRANHLKESHTGEAERIAQRLATEFADATQEALREAKARKRDLESRAKELGAAQKALAEAERTTSGISAVAERRRRAQEALAEAQKRLDSARKVLDTGEQDIAALSSRIEALEKEIAAIDYDPERHQNLRLAWERASQMENAAARAERAAEEAAGAEKSLAVAKSDSGAKSRALAEGREALNRAEQMREESRKHDLAAALRRGLSAGDPCPVCGQKIGALPAEEHPALDEAERAYQEARMACESADGAAQSAGKAAAVAEQALQAALKQHAEAQAAAESQREKLRDILPDGPASASEIAEAGRAIAEVKKTLDGLDRDVKSLREERDGKQREIAGARNSAAGLEADVKARTREISEADADIGSATEAIRRAAAEHGWLDVTAALEGGRDPLKPLKSRLGEVEGESRDVQRQLGACDKDIERIAESIEKAKELREQERSERAAARLAQDLASLLGVNRFPAFVREQALRTLARDGSQRLSEISGGRYLFEVQGQEFLVVDRWNGGEVRSVKTLSGGETFLASVALALALAEHLPGLAAGEGSGTLEALFIDEGFSYLDTETLDEVASALEVLGQDGRRLVGVVTHLPALAERMPARIVVHKSQAGSTVTVE